MRRVGRDRDQLVCPRVGVQYRWPGRALHVPEPAIVGPEQRGLRILRRGELPGAVGDHGRLWNDGFVHRGVRMLELEVR